MRGANEALIAILLGVSLDFVFAVIILLCRVLDIHIGIGFFMKVGLGADVVLVSSENVPCAVGCVNNIIVDGINSISHNVRTKTPMVITLITQHDIRGSSGETK